MTDAVPAGAPASPVIHIHGGQVNAFGALCGAGWNVAVTSAVLADTFGVRCEPCRAEARRLGLLPEGDGQP